MSIPICPDCSWGPPIVRCAKHPLPTLDDHELDRLWASIRRGIEIEDWAVRHRASVYPLVVWAVVLIAFGFALGLVVAR